MGAHLVDAALLLVVLFGAIGGWHSGFLLASVELLTLAASLLVAFLFYQAPAGWLEAQWPALGVWAPPLAFVGTLVLAHVLIGLVTHRAVLRLPKRAHLHAANRALGLAPGAVNGLVQATVVTLVLLVQPLMPQVSQATRDGMLSSRLADKAEWIEAQLSPIFEGAFRRTLQAITVPPESRTSVPLRFTVADPKPRPELEARMLELVNLERTSRGLKPVVADPDLREVARAHSRDMFARGYFSHVSPDGADLRDRLRKQGERYLVAGENLALAQTLAVAHNGLMRSPGHRANILRPQFGRLGIGVLDGGSHGLMVTQNFRN